MNIYINIRVFMVKMLVVCFLAAISGCAINTGQSTGTSYDEVIVVDSDVQMLFDQALQSLRAEQYDEAIILLDSVVEREKRLTAPYINLAMVHRRKGDEKLAEENLLKALSIDQAQPVANNELGLLYRKQGRFEDAKKVYTNALSEHPGYLPIIRNFGILCDLYMHDLQCALEQFEKYQQQVPDDKTIKIWIADIKTRI